MNQTIYFRKEIWEKLKDEEKKSELINNLLSDWYSGKIKNPMPQNQSPVVEFQPIKTPEQAIEKVKEIFPGAKEVEIKTKLCKHGKIPNRQLSP